MALVIHGKFDLWLIFEYELAHLDVSGGHEAPALPREFLDHDGVAIPLMSLSVSLLTLHSAVGDGVTFEAGEEHLATGLRPLTLAHGAGSPVL